MPIANTTVAPTATIPCTVKEFNAAFCQFFRAIGDKSNSQEGIANMYKCLVLHYLGIQTPTEAELQCAANVLETATSNAVARGWMLDIPY